MSNNAADAFERGKTYFARKEIVQAEREFLEAVRLEPTNAEYHAWLGRAYSSLKKGGMALAETKRALDLNPHCAVAQ